MTARTLHLRIVASLALAAMLLAVPSGAQQTPPATPASPASRRCGAPSSPTR